ncbi:hypothetical protein N7468_005852 [Penicillium chermesinum]|uniref:Alpha-tubulin suppressor protein Aats1 n=1 Tax=Penicillium chermesinum TaxID=63820 RepID=A0A9W9TNC6_9EURO|nr:uncharacterized protein N7468_005852 [Penicillium chermesinum]KAJ5232896.1 hypothetical protein N7468_005852 [Penicillium chermesinum]
MSIFALGSNGSGQLGIGHIEDVSTPTQCVFSTATPIAPNDEVTRITAGGNHTLLLTKQGHVYAAGCNDDGRCGPAASAARDKSVQTSNEANLLHFRRLVLPDPASGSHIETFKCISATWEGTILVASVPCPPSDSGRSMPVSTDRVFVLGSTPKGELGLGESAQSTPPSPGTCIPDFPPSGTDVIGLASGMGHTVAILSSGEVYGWGGARKGQLGEGSKARKIVWSPTRVDGIPFHAMGAVCGREFTVVLGRPGRGEFIVLGDPANRWGVLRIPDALRYDPVPAAGVGYLDIGASWHGIYVQLPEAEVQDQSGSRSLLAWGRDDRGQLPPKNLPSVRNLAVGSEHALALLKDGSVAAFGWGEHGNCGPDTDPRGNVAGEYKVIPLPHAGLGDRKIVNVGAGCATSWLMVK